MNIYKREYYDTQFILHAISLLAILRKDGSY